MNKILLFIILDFLLYMKENKIFSFIVKHLNEMMDSFVVCFFCIDALMTCIIL